MIAERLARSGGFPMLIHRALPLCGQDGPRRCLTGNKVAVGLRTGPSASLAVARALAAPTRRGIMRRSRCPSETRTRTIALPPAPASVARRVVQHLGHDVRASATQSGGGGSDDDCRFGGTQP